MAGLTPEIYEVHFDDYSNSFMDLPQAKNFYYSVGMEIFPNQGEQNFIDKVRGTNLMTKRTQHYPAIAPQEHTYSRRALQYNVYDDATPFQMDDQTKTIPDILSAIKKQQMYTMNRTLNAEVRDSFFAAAIDAPKNGSQSSVAFDTNNTVAIAFSTGHLGTTTRGMNIDKLFEGIRILRETNKVDVSQGLYVAMPYSQYLKFLGSRNATSGDYVIINQDLQNMGGGVQTGFVTGNLTNFGPVTIILDDEMTTSVEDGSDTVYNIPLWVKGGMGMRYRVLEAEVVKDPSKHTTFVCKLSIQIGVTRLFEESVVQIKADTNETND